MNYGEALYVESAAPTAKPQTIASAMDALSGNVMRLAQILNALCANMAGAEIDSPKEIPSAPLLAKLDMLTDATRYCLERADTLMKIMGQ